jgi:hypothetical protein
MSTIYAIDPGTTHSALVRVQDDGLTVGGMWTNDMLCINLHEGVFPQGVLVIEQIEAMGMAVGKETFETVFWSGRFAQAWEQRLRPWSRVTRRQVKLHLCGSMKAKDANIRQALIDRYGGIACTKKGGALHGIKSHLWAALAVAVTYRDQLASPSGDPQTPDDTKDSTRVDSL